jgi:uncharacterized phage protein (TIGR01671 family)
MQMREIKFRFWSKHLGKFVTPDDSIFVGALKDPDMNPMQYTGLKDKHGVEIYEGDVLAYRDGEWSYDAVVEWADHGWYMRGIEPEDNFNFDDLEADVHEVIGNIHADPDLLKAGVAE